MYAKQLLHAARAAVWKSLAGLSICCIMMVAILRAAVCALASLLSALAAMSDAREIALLRRSRLGLPLSTV